MSRQTPLTIQSEAVAGLNVAYVAVSASGAGNGVLFVNDGQTTLRVWYTGSGSLVVTVPNQQNNVNEGVVQPSQTYTIPAGNVTAQLFDIWVPPNIYNDVDNQTAADFSTNTGVKVAAVKLPRGFV